MIPRQGGLETCGGEEEREAHSFYATNVLFPAWPESTSHFITVAIFLLTICDSSLPGPAHRDLTRPSITVADLSWCQQ